MEKLVLFGFVALISLATITSCKSAKGTAPVGEIAVVDTKSQILAQEKPEIRDWGEGTSFNQSQAKTYAEGQARAAFSRKVSAMVQSASKQFGSAAQMSHSDGTNSSTGVDEGMLSENQAFQVSEELLKGTTVINTDTYKKADGQYHVYVCIEYRAGASDLASTISSKVGQQVSDDEVLKMKYDQMQFQKAIEDQLSKMKGNK